MMPAEKWYEYQKSYKRYGLDMKPTPPPKKVKKSKKAHTSIRLLDKIKLLAIILLVGTLCICLVITGAYSAQIKFEINSLTSQTERVQGEIENLNVALKSACNITLIEDRAINELGMVYPEIEQISYIGPDNKQKPEFALALKELAYR